VPVYVISQYWIPPSATAFLLRLSSTHSSSSPTSVSAKSCRSSWAVAWWVGSGEETGQQLKELFRFLKVDLDDLAGRRDALAELFDSYLVR
jgi:hypothetical protein